MEINFKGKVVIITGGASGAGVSIVKEFAKTGCDIALTYNSSSPDALLSELKGIKIKAYKLNQSNITEIKPFLENVIADFGHIDILVNNAGIYPAKKLDDISEEDYDQMLDTNAKGVLFLSREVSKYIKEGSIINVSSINATNPASKLIHYGMSKAAVEMATRCLAYEYGPNIRVNCIAPGLIYKEGQEKWIPGWRESYSERSALHRVVMPEEIGKAAIMLASDLASAITGQIITVDCGVSLSPYYDNSGEAHE